MNDYLIQLTDVAARSAIVHLQEVHHPWMTHLADMIEDQIPEPPRVPEPGNLGSLVTAAQVGGRDGSKRVWVRFTHCVPECWIDSLGHARSWSELIDPEPYPFEGEN